MYIPGCVWLILKPQVRDSILLWTSRQLHQLTGSPLEKGTGVSHYLLHKEPGGWVYRTFKASMGIWVGHQDYWYQGSTRRGLPYVGTLRAQIPTKVSLGTVTKGRCQHRSSKSIQSCGILKHRHKGLLEKPQGDTWSHSPWPKNIFKFWRALTGKVNPWSDSLN